MYTTLIIIQDNVSQEIGNVVMYPTIIVIPGNIYNTRVYGNIHMTHGYPRLCTQHPWLSQVMYTTVEQSWLLHVMYTIPILMADSVHKTQDYPS